MIHTYIHAIVAGLFHSHIWNTYIHTYIHTYAGEYSGSISVTDPKCVFEIARCPVYLRVISVCPVSGHTHTYTHTHIYIYIFTYIHTYIWIVVFDIQQFLSSTLLYLMYLYTRTYICACLYKYIYIHTYLYTCSHTYRSFPCLSVRSEILWSKSIGLQVAA